MRRILGHKDVHHLYGPGSRRKQFPNADFRFVVRAARNMATAFAILHEAGVVVGDVNFGGVAVSSDATVTLLDCDSFQVSGGGRFFPCQVGMPLFTPPEVWGRDLSTLRCTPNHDAFGLAVLIFHLLAMGRHPFAGRCSLPGEMPPEKAIREFRYVYGPRAAASRMAPPPHVPAVELMAGPAVAFLFERAFGPDGPAGRPTAREWMEALDHLFGTLKPCGRDAVHWHAGFGACPWCGFEKAVGVPLFGRPGKTAPAPAAACRVPGVDLRAVWDGVLAVPPPDLPPRGEMPPLEMPPVLPSLRTRFAAGAVFVLRRLGAGLLMLWLFLPSWAGKPLGWAGLGALAVSLPAALPLARSASVCGALAVRHARVRDRLVAAALAADAATDDAPFRRLRKRLAWVRDSLGALPKDRDAEARRLAGSASAARIRRHLRRYAVADAFAPDAFADVDLAAHGFRTAADVDEARLSAAGLLDDGRVAALLAWRDAVEGEFSPGADAGADAGADDLADLDADFARRRTDLEATLLGGADALVAAARGLEADHAEAMRALGDASRIYLDHLADLAAARA